MGSEASREAENILDSPPNSPEDIEIIDELSHESSTHFLSYAAHIDSQPTTTHEWIMDLGCTNHMFFDKDEFTDYQLYRVGVIIADGIIVWTQGRGTVEME